jgi:hypothetical protein
MYMPQKWNRCGGVKIVVMKHHMSLQATSSRKAQSKHLKLFMQKIGLSERGKLPAYENTFATKKISALTGGESGGTVPMKR